MSLVIKFYFTPILNMFRTLIHPSSGACDFSIVSPHWSCVLVSMCCWSFGVARLGWYPCSRLKHNSCASACYTHVPYITLLPPPSLNFLKFLKLYKKNTFALYIDLLWYYYYYYYYYYYLLLLPLALQPTVGFSLSNNVLPFFSYLPSTLSIFSLPALEDLFLLPLSSFSWVIPFFSSLLVLEWRSFWASYPPPFSPGDLTSLSVPLLSILLYFLLYSSLLVLDSSDFSIPRFHI